MFTLMTMITLMMTLMTMMTFSSHRQSAVARWTSGRRRRRTAAKNPNVAFDDISLLGALTEANRKRCLTILVQQPKRLVLGLR